MTTSPISLTATHPTAVSLPLRWFSAIEQHKTFQLSIHRTLNDPPEWFARRGLKICEATILEELPKEFQSCITVAVPSGAFVRENMIYDGVDEFANDTVGAFVRTGRAFFIREAGWSGEGKLLIPSPIQANHLTPSWPISIIGSYGEPSLAEILSHLRQGQRPAALFYPGAPNNLPTAHGTGVFDPLLAYFHDLTHASFFCGEGRDAIQRIASRLFGSYVEFRAKQHPQLVALEGMILLFCDGKATRELIKPSRSKLEWSAFLARELAPHSTPKKSE